MKTPRGYKDGTRLKVSVAFEPNVLRAICRRCRSTNKPFNFVVNDLIKCGLLDVEESERDELEFVTPIGGLEVRS
jgi:hypothetical protein